MLLITFRILSIATGYSLSSLKRWAVSIFGHDEATGQHSGKTRLFSFDQGFVIYLGGYLIHELEYSPKHAKRIVHDIMAWLEAKNLMPSGYVRFLRRGNTWGHDKVTLPTLIFDIGQDAEGEFFYRVNRVVHEEPIPDPDDESKTVRKVIYREHLIGKGQPPPTKPYKTVELKTLVEQLARGVCYAMNEKA